MPFVITSAIRQMKKKRKSTADRKCGEREKGKRPL